MSNHTASSEFELRIEKLVYGGDGLGRTLGKVVFVPFSVPGDLLLVRTVERKKNFLRAVPVKVIEPGPGRCQPGCPYFGSCGGCQWQQLEYARQVETKEGILREALHHHFPESRKASMSFVPSPAEYGYRSRARLQLRGWGPDLRLGFYRFRSREVEDIQVCPLLRPTLNEALAALRAGARSRSATAADSEIEIACSEEDGRWASAETNRGGSEAQQLLERNIEGFTYRASPADFFQANDFLTPVLVQTVRELAKGAGSRAALDLFSGAGLFSLPLARQYASVTAVENSPQACELCSRNAGDAGFSNVRVVCADVARWLSAVGSVSAPGADLVLLDPPRTGAGTEVMGRLGEWAPETIIYVSCDPQTLVRDLQVIPAREYEIDAVVGLDMFPQTYHFETVIKLKRR